MSPHRTLALIALATVACAGPQNVDTGGAADERTIDATHVTLSAWIPTVDMRNIADGVPSKIDMSYGDTGDPAQTPFDGSVEMWDGDTGYIIRGQYIDLDDDSSGQAAVNSNHLRQDTVDLVGAWRYSFGERRDERQGNEDDEDRGLQPVDSLSIDLMGGVRYQHVNNRVGIPGAPSASSSHDWVEPLIGARVLMPILRRFTLEASGDMSGFDVGSGSHRTWNAFGGANWQLNISNAIRFGWRVYGIKWDRGSGTAAAGLDGQMSGPVLGWTFTF